MKVDQSAPSVDRRVDGVSTHQHAADTDMQQQNSMPPPAGHVSDMMSCRLSHLDRMSNWREAWNPRLSMSLANTKGLMNAPGDNNCFLNSAVQVLWHLDVFRRSFRLLSGHACMGHSCIFCTLKVLFTQLQYSDRSTLPPDALRRALASSFQDQHRFQLGHMDDAAECFENILTRIHYHIAQSAPEDTCTQLHCIPHQKFAMNIVEQIVCQCGATTQPLPFTQMVHYVSANALVSCQANLAPYDDGSQCPTSRTPEMFAQLLRTATSAGDIRNCPSNCGEKVQIRRTLTNAPDVVSIGLIWDSDRPTLDHIKDVVRSIGTTIRLQDLFHLAPSSTRRRAVTLHLVGVVCYYGKHYSTFFFHSNMKKWVYFDDAHVKEMGPAWNNVADKCCRGHYQPLLLLYANQECEPVQTHTAPETTTKLPGYQHFNGGQTSQPESENGQQQQPKQGQQQSQEQQQHRDTSVHRNINPNIRRAMTPGPEQRYHAQHTVMRRAITPGPEYGRYNSGEDETDSGGVAHFRQSSYLIAVDGPQNSSSVEKVPRSKTATHGGDPYYNVQSDLQLEKQNNQYENRYVDQQDHEQFQAQHHSRLQEISQQGNPDTPHGQQEHQHHWEQQGSQRVHLPGQQQGQPGHKGSTNGKKFQYVAPQTHPPPVAQKPKVKTGGLQCNPNTTLPNQLQHQQQQLQEQYQQQTPHQQPQPSSEYQDWTLSTSEPYRRQNMPKNQENRALDSRDSKPQDAGFIYPTSPAKTKNSAQLAKVNEIQRLESFKKGKGKIGADVVRYQISPTDKPAGVNPYGPLDPEALYPGHESGVMQSPKGGPSPFEQSDQQEPQQSIPNSQSHPVLKSVRGQAPQEQQTNLKRTRSLEGPLAAEGQPSALVSPYHGELNTAGHLRPQSARPFENGLNSAPTKGPPTTPKLGRKSEYKDAQPPNLLQGSEPILQGEVVEGKPPRSASRGPNWREDPYGTLQYINRRAVENVLTYQHQKPGASTMSRARTLSQGGPGSIGSRSSNSSLESATEQMTQIGLVGLPPRPNLPGVLSVEIPGDKDSGYRSGSSAGGDQNSTSSITSGSVNSPGSSRPIFHQREPTTHGGQFAHPQLQQTLSYANPDTKSHSSTDSLSSGQSGQSHVTVKAAYGHQQQPNAHQHASEQKHQEPPPQRQHPIVQHQYQGQQQYGSPSQKQQKPQHHQAATAQQQYHVQQQYNSLSQKQYTQQQPQQHQPPSTQHYQGQQQHDSTSQHAQQQQQQRQQHQVTSNNPYDQSHTESIPSVAHQAQQSDNVQVTAFKAEAILDESNQKERDGDLSAALALCTQAIGCLQQAISNPTIGSEMKSYLRMKHNTCLLKSRSLHRRLALVHDNSNSDMSTEDHTSISSQSTDGDVRELIDSPQHLRHQFPTHIGGAPQQFPMPGSAVYEQQYSSDSGYSSHSLELAYQQQHQQSQQHQQNHKLPHSFTDGAISEHQRQQKQLSVSRDWKTKHLHQQPKQQYEETESNNRSIEAYATLPRKRSPKTKILPAMPVRAGPEKNKEAELYQVYLQRQKENGQLWQKHDHGQHSTKVAQYTQQTQAHPNQIQSQTLAHLQGQSKGYEQGEIQAQGSNNSPQFKHQTSKSKMNKEQIKQILIHDFMARKEGKREGGPGAIDQNLEQARLHNMVSNELPGQVKSLNIKDAKRAQSEMNLHQVDDCSTPVYIHTQHHQNNYSNTAARGYMVHPDCNQLDIPAGVHHSRDSSCSSTTTLKGHSRENSLTSPPLSPKSYQTQNVQKPIAAEVHPAYRGGMPHSAVDRDTNPPKPSMIGKLDKMHQQEWTHQQGTFRQNENCVAQANIRKTVSHAQLPMFNNGLDSTDSTARSEGADSHIEGTPVDTPNVMTTDMVATEQDDFPPPPPELLQWYDDEPLPPPPPELLFPPIAADVKPTLAAKPKVPPKPLTPTKPNIPMVLHPGAVRHDQTRPIACTIPTPPELPPPSEAPAPSNTNSSVSALVASIEGNTVAIQHRPTSIKMKAQQTNCTFSTFFAPPDDQSDRSSLSSVDSNSLNLSRSTFGSDSSSYQASTTGSNFSNTDSCEQGESRQPRRPCSALRRRKKREGRQRKKSVTFSEDVALVVDKEALAESQSIDYIQYVSKVLEQSQRRRAQPGDVQAQNHDRMATPAPTPTPTVSQVLDTRDSRLCNGKESGLSNGYDSDFDEDTASSASSTDGDCATRCDLCSKKVVEVDEIYCTNCKFYMSRFQPTTSTPS